MVVTSPGSSYQTPVTIQTGTVNPTVSFTNEFFVAPPAGGGTATFLAPSDVTSATWAGGTATIGAVDAINTFTPGETVVVAGMTPAGYDGTFTILTVTANTITYALPGPALAAATAPLGTATPVNITGATWVAGTATIDAVNTFSVGQSVTIAGMVSPGPGSFNGTYTILSATATEFTYALAVNPGVASAFGSVNSATPLFKVGQFVDINLPLDPADDGIYPITASNATSFTFVLPAPMFAPFFTGGGFTGTADVANAPYSPVDVPLVPIESASWSNIGGGTATITYNIPPSGSPFQVGQLVDVEDVSDTTYDTTGGPFAQIESVFPGGFTYALVVGGFGGGISSPAGGGFVDIVSEPDGSAFVPTGAMATGVVSLQATVVQPGANSAQLQTTSGVLAMGATDSVIFFGTGNANNGADSYYGTGVYESTTAGQTWQLLTDPTLANAPLPGDPLYGQVINSMIYDPGTVAGTAGYLYVATSDLGTNAALEGNGTENAPTEDNPGVWRYDLTNDTWFNMTDLASTARLQNGNNDPGPDDVIGLPGVLPQWEVRDIIFPQTGISWTGLALNNGNLYASLGSAAGSDINGVYDLTNPEAANDSSTPPAWDFGGTVTTQAPFGTPAAPLAGVAAYNESPGVAATSFTSPLDYPAIPVYNAYAGDFESNVTIVGGPPIEIPFGNMRVQVPATNTIYAATAYPAIFVPPAGPPQTAAFPPFSYSSYQFLESTDDGTTWAPLAAQPPNYLANDGSTSMAFLADPNGSLFLGGTDAASMFFPTTTLDYVLEYTPATGAWQDISVDIVNNGPHTGVNNFTLDNGNLLTATNGGIWLYYLNSAVTNNEASFVQPAVGATVSVTMANTAWLSPGQTVHILNGGYYEVAYVTSLTTVSLINLGTPPNVPLGFAGNVAPGTTINASTPTTGAFGQPGVGGVVNVSVPTTAWMTLGETLYVVSDGANGGYYSVTAIPGPNLVTLKNLGSAGSIAPGLIVPVSPGNINSNNTWKDINGNLDNVEFSQVVSNPTNASTIYGVGPAIDTVVSTGNLTWTQVSVPVGGFEEGLGASSIAVDPNNPSTIYVYQNVAPTNPGSTATFGQPYTPLAILFSSTNGGATWANTGISYAVFDEDIQSGPVVIDSLSRVFAGKSVNVAGLDEGFVERYNPTNPAAGWQTLNLPLLPSALNIVPTAIAVGELQGPFQTDPRFLANDTLANKDLGASISGSGGHTVYITDSQTIELTKDDGTLWVVAAVIPNFVAGFNEITDIKVSPVDRDEVFVVVGGTAGLPDTGTVWESTNAGQTWVPLSGGLPSQNLSSISILDGGSGYAVAPNVVISSPFIPITGAVWAAGTVTITNVNEAFAFYPGQAVVISGLTPAAYDGTFTVEAVNLAAGTFTYALTLNPGAAGGFFTATASAVGAVQATAVATITGGVVTGITITNPGSGYNYVNINGFAPVSATIDPPSITDSNFPNIPGADDPAIADVLFGGLPAWTLAIDPRTISTGVGMYLGTDRGVYELDFDSAGARVWVPFGDNLPQVAVHSLDLNVSTNILTAGTYGRGAFQFYLDTPTVEAGALYAAGGANIWEGPIILSGPATIGVAGNQVLQNGVAAVPLTIQGVISDQTYAETAGALNTLTKVGSGNLLIEGGTPNLYGGTTDITAGNLIVQNPGALGASSIVGTQELTLTGGVTSLTLAYNGSGPSVAIAITGVAATDAVTIQAALQALSTISPANVTVTPGALAGTFLITSAAFTGNTTALTAANVAPVAGSASAGTVGTQELFLDNFVGGTTAYTLSFNGATLPADPLDELGGELGVGTATVTVPVANIGNFAVGQTVVIAGMTPIGYNGAFTILSVNPIAGTFTYALAGPLLAGSGGTATAAITYTGNAVTDAGNIAAALEGLFTISPNDVIVTPNGAGVFLITSRALAGVNVPMILPTVVAGAGSGFSMTAGGTIISGNSVLQLTSDLEAEPLFLFGNGVTTSGHNSGAVENTEGDNTYTGTITLENNATIGVDNGTTLTITTASPTSVLGIVDLGGAAGQFSLTKENTGTLILASTNNYEGGTIVNQGALNIQNSNALIAGPVAISTVAWSGVTDVATVTAPNTFIAGQSVVIANVTSTPAGAFNGTFKILSATSSYFTYALAAAPAAGYFGTATPVASTTTVLDQAQLQLQGGVNVPDENLVLSGAGDGTGALLNVSGNNSWGGAGNTVTLTSTPTYSPQSTPAGAVTIGVVNAGDSLTIGSSIGEAAAMLEGTVAAAGTPTLSPTAPVAGGGAFAAGSYYYVVTAIVNGVESLPSNEVKATGVPAGGHVNLTWTPVANATSYNIYRTAVPTNPVSALSGSFASPSLVENVPAVGLVFPVLDTGNPTSAGTPSSMTLASGLTKVGLGTLVLASNNTYHGTTVIQSGIIDVQQPTALGLDNGDAIQRLTVVDPSVAPGPSANTFTLKFTTAAGVVKTAAGIPVRATAATVAADLNAAIGAGSVDVTMNEVYTGISGEEEIKLTGVSAALATQSQITLTLGSATATIPYTGVAATDAADIQTALDQMAAISGISPFPGIGTPLALGATPSPYTGFVEVTPNVNDTAYTVTFDGMLADQDAPFFGVAVNSGLGSAVPELEQQGYGIPTDVYTITFVGAALSGQAQNPLTVTPSAATMTTNISTVADGGMGTVVYNGAALQIDGDPLETGASITIPFVSQTGTNATIGNAIVLNGTGVNNTGALLNVSGNNTVGANVVLAANPPTGTTSIAIVAIGTASNVAIGANATTTLKIGPASGVGGPGGIVQYASPAPAYPASLQPISLTKLGTGTLDLSGANNGPGVAFTGDTYVTAGALDVQNPNALGVNTTAVQTLKLSPDLGGSFTLGFVGYAATVTTGTILLAPASALSLATLNTQLAEMMALPGAPGGGTGTAIAAATSLGNVWTITFGGSLANQPVPMLNVQFVFGETATIDLALAGGSSGTYVAAGASLQMQTSDSSGKALTIVGNGVNNAGALDNVSATINNWDAAPLTAPITLGGPAYVGALAGGTLNIDQPITDSYQAPTLQFTNFTGGDSYRLSYGGDITSSLTYTGADAGTIQAALAALPSVAALVSSPITGATWSLGTATVTAANTFVAGQNVTITGMTPGSYDGTYTILSASSSQFTYSLAGPVTVATAPFGSAEATNAVSVTATLPNEYLVLFNNTPFGTLAPSIVGVRLSGAGTFTTASGAATSFGSGLTKVGAGIVQYNVGNTYTGLTDVHAGRLQLDDPGFVTITGANWMPGAPTGTAIITAPNTFSAGQIVTITGMAPAAYNGTFTILTATGFDFTYALATNPATATAPFGTANVPGPGTVSVTAATWANNTATIAAVNTFSAGQTVTIAGMTPTAYNGVFTILSANGAGFTYTLTTDPAIATAFGPATVPSVAVDGNLRVGDATPVNQVQTLTFTDFQQLDQFTLTYGANPATAPITYYQNSTLEAAAIQTALNAVLGAGFVSVAPAAAGVFLVSFPGLIATDPAATISGTDLTAAATSISASITTPGSGVAHQVQTLTLTGYTAGATFQLTYGANPAAGPIPYSGIPANDAAAIQVALNLVLGAGYVSVAPSTPGVFLVTFVGLGATNPPTLLGGINLAAVASVITTHGAGPVANSAVAQLEASNQVVNTAAVAVNSDGLFDLNNFTQTINTLTIVDGNVTTGTGTLTVTGAFNQTGGAVNLGGAGSSMTLDSTITAVSDATGSADIAGQGSLILNDGSPELLQINHGPQTTDLLVTAPIVTDVAGVSTPNVPVVKNGAGQLELASESLYTGDTDIDQGTLQVDSVFTLNLTGAPGAFTLKYNNGADSGTTGAITYTAGNSTATAASILSLLQTLFATFVPALSSTDVTVNPLGANIFTIAFNGLAAVGAVQLTSATVGVTAPTRGNDLAGSAVLNGNGANLSGTGQVGGITIGAAVTGAANVTVDPGNNNASPNTGALQSSTNVVWNVNSTYFVDLITTSNDVLNVTGSINLGGATLTGTAATNIPVAPVPQSFTIITFTPGGLSGTFAEPYGLPEVFISGQKFTVTYNNAAGTVVLTRALDLLTGFTITPTANPSIYGQDVTFTAKVTAEPGALMVPGSGLQIVFHLDAAGSTPVTETVNVVVDVSGTFGTATFDPQTFNAYTWAAGSHTLDATFVDNTISPITPTFMTETYSTNFNAGSPYSQTVNEDPVSITGTTITPPSLTYGNPVTLQATITPNPAVNPLLTNPNSPTGSVTFTVSNGQTYPGTFVSGTLGAPSVYQAIIPYTDLNGTTPYTVAVSFGPDSNADYQTDNLVPVAGFTYNPNGTGTTVTSVLPATSNYGAPVTFSATVAANSGLPGTPAGTVFFYAGSNLIGSAPVSAGAATFTTDSTHILPAGSYSNINAVFVPTGTNYLGSTSLAYGTTITVNQDPTTTAVSVTPTGSYVYGEPFIVTVSTGLAPIYGQPLGTVTLWNGAIGVPANQIGIGTLTSSNDPITINPSAAALFAGSGPYTINASFTSGAGSNFSGSDTTLTGSLTISSVGQAGTTVTVASATPASGDVYGESVALVADVTPNSPSTATINVGTVQFSFGATFAGSTPIGSPQNVSGGVATYNTLPTDLGVNSGAGWNIYAVYTDSVNSNYAGSNNSSSPLGSYLVAPANTKVTSVTATSSPSSDVFGQTVTLTANLATLNPSNTTVLGGNVKFYDNTISLSTLLATSGTVAGGTASATTTALSVGNHTIIAVYSGDTPGPGDFNGSQGSSGVFTVGKASTSVAVSATPASPGTYGVPVTFKALVSSLYAPANSTDGEMVSFVDVSSVPNVPLGTGILSGGVATITTSTTQLSVSTHVIEAMYLGDSNFIASNGTLPGNYTVNPAPTALSIVPTSANSPVTYGNTVTLTATVTSGGLTIPAGCPVKFFDNTNTVLGTALTIGTTGVATLTTTALVGGSNTITATFNDTKDTNFQPTTGSTSPAIYTVQAASTMTNLAITGGTVYGATVTLTATVAPVGIAITGAAWAAGTATITVANNFVAGQTVTVSGSGGYNGTFTILTANAANFTYALAANPGSPALGAATVLRLPSGSAANFVTFTDTTSSTTTTLGTATIINGVAILNTTMLVGGGNSITATYTDNLDGNFATSSNTPPSYNLTAAATSVSVSSNGLTSSSYGTPVTFTAIVRSGAGVPNVGTVAFTDEQGLSLGVPQSVVGGIATITTSVLPVPAAIAITGVSWNAGTATITAPNSFVAGQSAVIISGMTSSGPGTYNGEFIVQTATTSSFTYTLAVNPGTATVFGIATPTHTIIATYTDATDLNYAGNVGAEAGFAVNPASTTTSVVANPASGFDVYGQPISLTATVSGGAFAIPDGSTVNFYDGGVFLNSATTLSGVATLNNVILSSAGNQLVTATFLSAGNFLGSSGSVNGGTYNVGPANTTILAPAFTATPSISAVNQLVTLSATVTVVSPSSASIPVNAGTVTFVDTTTGLTLGGGAIPVNINGTATVAVSFATAGSHNVTAIYNHGSSPDFNSMGAPVALAPAQTVRNISNIAVKAVTSAFFGTTLSYPVTVSGVGGTPVGTISVYIDGSAIAYGTYNLTGGAVTIPISGLSAVTSPHSIQFSYSGDNVGLGYAPNSVTINQVVSPAAATTTLSPTVASFYGQPVTFNATVTSSAGTPTTGVVNFYDGTTLIGSGNLGPSNTASFPTTATQLAVGNHTITAKFAGAGNFAASTAASTAQTQTVKLATTQTVVSPPTATTYGNNVTLTATVNTTSGGSPGPITSGTVKFFKDGATTPFATVTLTAITGNVVSTTTTTPLTAGNHTITAVYSGNTFFAASTSTAATQVINKATTQVTFSAPSIASGAGYYGQAVTFTANVSVLSGTPGTLTGTVAFWQGATTTAAGGISLGSATVSKGVATLKTTATGLAATSAGLPIYAVYTSTNANAGGSTGTLPGYVLNPVTTSLTLTPSAVYWGTGQTITFVATVAAASGGTPGTPAGTVTLTVTGPTGATTTQTLSAGKTVFAFKFTTTGIYTVAATYHPTSGNFSSTTAVPLSQDVLTPTALSVITASPASPQVNATTKLSVTLTGPNIVSNTGIITFLQNGVPITVLVGGVATAPTVTAVSSPTNPNAITYSISVPFDTTGKYSITAFFDGDSTFDPALSPALILTVQSRLN